MGCVAEDVDAVSVAVAKARLTIKFAKPRLATLAEVTCEAAFSAVLWIFFEVDTDFVADGEILLA